MEKKEVSVVIPVYNEQKYIKKCLDSCLLQDYTQKNIEYLIVDGMSTDQTRIIIKEYVNKYPNLFKMIDNKKRFTPYALNAGIINAVGEYLIIMACHSEYATNFISKSIEVSKEINADVVGGYAETKSKSYVGMAMAIVLSSKFGVGNSSFRTGGINGYADTAFCGCCKRDIFEKYGMFNEELVRNQDLEFNKRVINNGGKIYLSNQIKLSYYTPDTLYQNLRKAYDNGKWNIYTMISFSGIIGVRHLVPLMFVLSLILLPFLCFVYPIFYILLITEILLYLVLNIYFSLKEIKMFSIKYICFLPFLFTFFHISYGLGSLCGVLSLIKKNIRRKKR